MRFQRLLRHACYRQLPFFYRARAMLASAVLAVALCPSCYTSEFCRNGWTDWTIERLHSTCQTSCFNAIRVPPKITALLSGEPRKNGRSISSLAEDLVLAHEAMYQTWGILAPTGNYDWTICARRRCGLKSNYSEQLLTICRRWKWLTAVDAQHSR